MPLRNFLLSLHIIGAIVGLGPTFVFPLIGVLSQREGAPVVWFLRLGELMETRLILPISLVILPGTGAGLIVTSNDLWSPWSSQNRWLLASIILYTIAIALVLGVQGPSAKRALQMAEQGSFGPEFGALMQRMSKTGMLLTAILLTVAVLMIVKPGSGFIHP